MLSSMKNFISCSLTLFFIAIFVNNGNGFKPNLTTETCRVECTVIGLVNGKYQEFSGKAGGIFTNCETAGEKACEKAEQQLEEAQSERWL